MLRLLTVAIMFLLIPDIFGSSDQEVLANSVVSFISNVLKYKNPILVVRSNNLGKESSPGEKRFAQIMLREFSKISVPFTYYDMNGGVSHLGIESKLDKITLSLFTQFGRLITEFSYYCVILYGQNKVLIYLRKDKLDEKAMNLDSNLTRYVNEGVVNVIEHDFLAKIPNYDLRKVTIASVITFPFVNEMNTGIDNEIMKVIAKRFNFTPEFLHPADHQWGNYNNGTWSGAVGMLHRKVAQFAVGQLSRIPLREQFVDFTYPYAWDSVTFMVRSPRPLPKAMVLIKPFSKEVWLATLFSFISVSIVLKIILIYEGKSEVPFSAIILYLFGSLFQQGRAFYSDDVLKVRSVIFCWWIVCIVVIVLYSTCLISMFNVDIYEKGIETRKDLELALKKGQYVGGTVNGSTFLMNIRNSYDGSFGEMRKAILKDKSLITGNLRVGVTKSLSENYAFVFSGIALKSHAQAMTPPGSNMFHLSSDRYYTTCYGIATTKGYPYKDAMDKMVISMVESGLIRYWKNRMITEGLTDPNSGSRGHHHHAKRMVVQNVKGKFAFRFKDVKIAFDVLCIGYVFAVHAVILEIIWRSSFYLTCTTATSKKTRKKNMKRKFVKINVS